MTTLEPTGTVATPAAPERRPLAGTGWRDLVRVDDLAGRLAIAGTVALGLGLAAAWMALQYLAPIDHDSGAILYFSERWWGGERLYVDLIDVNPPLVFILNLLPVLLAKATGLGTPAALTTTVFAAILASTWTVWRLLLARSGAMVADRPGTLTATFVPIVLLLSLVSVSELGQREHLMLVLGMPYLTLAALRLEGVRIGWTATIAIAVTGAAAFALKPFFLIVPLAVEAFVLVMRRRAAFSDPVPWVMAGFWALYGAAIVVFFPAFVQDILPTTFELYSRLGEASPMVAFNRTFLPLEIAILAVAGTALLLRLSSVTQVFAIAVIAMAATTVVQGKGWNHQWAHADMGLVLLAGAIIAAAVDRFGPRDPGHRRRLGAVTGVAVLMLAFMSTANDEPPWERMNRFGPGGRLGAQIGLVEREQAQGHKNLSYLALSPGIYPYFPMVSYTGTRMAMPYMSMWVLQGVYHQCPASGPLVFNRAEAMSRAERHVFEAVTDGFVRNKPRLLVVDRVPGMPTCDGQIFDYLAYFLQNPRFAEEFLNYQMLTVFERYIVYRRR